MRLATLVIAITLMGIAGTAQAQCRGGSGVLVRAVHDSANVAVSGARVEVVGTGFGVVTSADGAFRLVNIPAGPRTGGPGKRVRRSGTNATSLMGHGEYQRQTHWQSAF